MTDSPLHLASGSAATGASEVLATTELKKGSCELVIKINLFHLGHSLKLNMPLEGCYPAGPGISETSDSELPRNLPRSNPGFKLAGIQIRTSAGYLPESAQQQPGYSLSVRRAGPWRSMANFERELSGWSLDPSRGVHTPSQPARGAWRPRYLLIRHDKCAHKLRHGMAALVRTLHG